MHSKKQSLPESTKVRSLLTLAGGAAALPLAVSPADAAIIVDASLSGTVIGWNTGAGQTRSVTTSSLPGGGGFNISTRATASGGMSAPFFGYVGVLAAWNGPGNGVFRRGGPGLYPAYLAPFGPTVANGTGAGTFANINLATSGGSNIGNSAFSGSSKYLLFSFDNSGTTNYGWIELTMTTTGVTGGVSNYSATLGDWAYDNSGAQLAAGVVPVPEPSTLSMSLIGGALVAGAGGLRRWRKQRAALVPKDGAQG